MVEKKEGAIMDCLNCGTELKCGWSKPSDTFKQKLQWQNQNGKAHYKYENGEYLCIDENGEVIPTKKELDSKNKNIQDEQAREQDLSKGRLPEIKNGNYRSQEQKVIDAIQMVELLWCPSLEKAKEVYSVTGLNTDPTKNKDVMILGQVFFKAMVESWNK